MSIGVIETRYAGYHFRSRTEARWAALFNALGVKWSYEPEGYKLSTGAWYLPDFFIKMHACPTGQRGYWVEVKGTAPTTDEVQKLRLLCMDTGHHGLLMVGAPGANCPWSFDSNGLVRDLSLPSEPLGVQLLDDAIADFAAHEDPMYTTYHSRLWECWDHGAEDSCPDAFERAVTYARSHRFGEGQRTREQRQSSRDDRDGQRAKPRQCRK